MVACLRSIANSHSDRNAHGYDYTDCNTNGHNDSHAKCNSNSNSDAYTCTSAFAHSKAASHSSAASLTRANQSVEAGARELNQFRAQCRRAVTTIGSVFAGLQPGRHK